ncbi:MAG: Shikimate kinase 1 [Acidimicrobiales bacterium]|nr:Shikimate kinase 1 [Acidimicrobiales bacterium]
MLVGLSGVGKSTIGRELAAELGMSFADLDELIEQRVGATIVDIFDSYGEAMFREHEARVLAEVLARDEPAVVSTGGGVVLREENRRIMVERGTTIWLDADLDAILQRVGEDKSRPLLAGDAAAALGRLAREREPLYREVADLTVSAVCNDPSQVVRQITSHLQGKGAG